MAKTTSSEENKANQSKKTGLDKFKREVGPVGFIGAIVGVVVLVVATALFFLNYQKEQNNIVAQNEIFQAQYYYESDSLELALLGDGRNLGFLDIIDIYGGTDVANLAHFYAGASYLKQRQYQQAIDYLEDFSTDENIVQARAKSLIGDAYMELGNFSDAAKNYEAAANTIDDSYFAPGYLLKAALAYEKNTDLEKAIKALATLINDYKDAEEILEARKQKARLEALANR